MSLNSSDFDRLYATSSLVLLRAESTLDSWQQWEPRPTVRPQITDELAHGLTNKNFKLQTSQGDAVLRLPHPQSDVLGIDRQRERLIIKALAGEQINTDVWFHDEVTGIMVSRYVSGIFTSADNLTPQQKEKVLQLIQRYQSIDLDLPKFDYVAHLTGYRKRVLADESLSSEWEDEWQCFLPNLVDWQNSSWKPVLCHHDLTGKNLVCTNDGWRLLDWEYAAMGHPAIDSIGMGVNSEILDGEEEELLKKLMMWMDRYWLLLRERR